MTKFPLYYRASERQNNTKKVARIYLFRPQPTHLLLLVFYYHSSQTGEWEIRRVPSTIKSAQKFSRRTF